MKSRDAQLLEENVMCAFGKELHATPYNATSHRDCSEWIMGKRLFKHMAPRNLSSSQTEQ